MYKAHSIGHVCCSEYNTHVQSEWKPFCTCLNMVTGKNERKKNWMYSTRDQKYMLEVTLAGMWQRSRMALKMCYGCIFPTFNTMQYPLRTGIQELLVHPVYILYFFHFYIMFLATTLLPSLSFYAWNNLQTIGQKVLPAANFCHLYCPGVAFINPLKSLFFHNYPVHSLQTTTPSAILSIFLVLFLSKIKHLFHFL
jgi:hypothetical protein